MHRVNLEAAPRSRRLEVVPIEASSEIQQALFALPRQAARLKPDLLLKTHESGGYVKGLPTVTVCHDIDELIWAAQGESWNPARRAINYYKQKLRRKLLRSSDCVVCNSEFIRKAVQTYYGIPPTKTAVGYCAVDARFYEYACVTNAAAVRKKYGLNRFILAFATGDNRENYSRYPELVAKLAELEVDSCLLVAGTKPGSIFALELRKAFLQRGLVEGRHFVLEEFLGEARFRDLVDLYTAADFYLELSLHEGFGMQLVEAMACGTTCISSPCGALTEIGDRYALFADPCQIDEIANLVKRAYAEKLEIRDNSEQVRYTRKFSWDETSQVISEILMERASRCNSGCRAASGASRS
jgi:glycosyltransferase involved in cell wall biosynthesis